MRDELKKYGQEVRQIIVIIPVYNCVNFLQKAVMSVLQQPYQAIKVVLIDDGSTDGSSILCDELAYREERVDVIHQKNSGVSKARNLGLQYIYSNRKSANDYVAFLDADDLWKENWLNDSIIGLLYQDFDLIGLQSCNCNALLTRRSNPRCMQEGKFRGGTAAIWLHAEQHIGAMLYREEFLIKNNIWFYNIKASEDKIFSMQCLYLANNIYLVNHLMYFYRQNVTSSMHTRKKGISHFVPIIDAYLQSDREMAKYYNNVRGELKEGRILAKIFLMDMIEEELETISGVKKIKELLNKRPEYKKIMEMSTNEQIDKRWEYIQSSRKKVMIKNYIYGFLVAFARKIYYIRPVKYITDQQRYPIKMK